MVILYLYFFYFTVTFSGWKIELFKDITQILKFSFCLLSLRLLSLIRSYYQESLFLKNHHFIAIANSSTISQKNIKFLQIWCHLLDYLWPCLKSVMGFLEITYIKVSLKIVVSNVIGASCCSSNWSNILFVNSSISNSSFLAGIKSILWMSINIFGSSEFSRVYWFICLKKSRSSYDNNYYIF